jgi:hypothetical protein
MADEAPTDTPSSGTVPYSAFKERHPDYHLDYWDRCRAFYKGGPSLLEDSALMQRVFPQRRNEHNGIYETRKAMAFYTNYAGEIINHMLALLTSRPLRVASETETDEFYKEFYENVAPHGKQRKSVPMLIRDLMLTAMQCRRAWALVELPKPEGQYASQAEQEAAGELEAWAVEIAPESVIDWNFDESGELEWALVMFKKQPRTGLLSSRKEITECYYLYTRGAWAEWRISYQEGKPPKDTDPVNMVSSGPLSIPRVPLVCLELPEGLWVMSKLESICREHFNKRNALAWAEYKTLLPILYEFVDPGQMPMLSGPGGSEDRAINQTRSVGHVQERQASAGGGDRVEWISPPDAPFAHALKSCDSLRDEMHRVVHEMALSADNSGKMLVRSGESKKQDSASLAVVLEALGEICREFIVRLYYMIGEIRQDSESVWTSSGMDDFDTMSSTDVLNEEAILDTAVQIPSPTFKTIRKMILVKKLLGDSISEEDLAKIESEIKLHNSVESEQAKQEDNKLNRAEAEATANGEYADPNQEGPAKD